MPPHISPTPRAFGPAGGAGPGEDDAAGSGEGAWGSGSRTCGAGTEVEAHAVKSNNGARWRTQGRESSMAGASIARHAPQS